MNNIPEHLHNEATQFRSHFPYRLCFIALHPTDEKQSCCFVAVTKHRSNSLVRKGWKVFQVK